MGCIREVAGLNFQITMNFIPWTFLDLSKQCGLRYSIRALFVNTCIVIYLWVFGQKSVEFMLKYNGQKFMSCWLTSFSQFEVSINLYMLTPIPHRPRIPRISMN